MHISKRTALLAAAGGLLLVIAIVLVAALGGSSAPTASSILKSDGYMQVQVPSADLSQLSQYSTSAAAGTNSDSIQVVAILNSQGSSVAPVVVSEADADGFTANYDSSDHALVITGTDAQWNSLSGGF